MFTVTPIPNISAVEFIHDRYQVGRCKLWLPEAITTIRGNSCVYPAGMVWRRDGNDLVQQATVEQAFGPGNFTEVEPGMLECAGIRSVKEASTPWQAHYRFSEDRVDFTLTVHNPNARALSMVAAEVCVKFLEGDWWDDSRCFLLTADGIRDIAQLGRGAGLQNTFQAWLLAGESYDHPFMREFWGFNATRAMAPVWVSRNEEAGCSVVVGCDAAYFIHSNAGNPCTDLAMKFGDLPPGASATCAGYLALTTETPEEIFARGMRHSLR